MKRRLLARWVLGGALILAGACASTPRVEPGVRVDVEFREPEKFRDVKAWPNTEAMRDAVLAELRDYARRAAASRMPAGSSLSVTVTDIDLAGEVEPWRGPSGDETRIVRAIYPPRIALEFRLTDASGAVLREGSRVLEDLNFQSGSASVGSDPLRHDKKLLSDWARREFRGLK